DGAAAVEVLLAVEGDCRQGVRVIAIVVSLTDIDGPGFVNPTLVEGLFSITDVAQRPVVQDAHKALEDGLAALWVCVVLGRAGARDCVVNGRVEEGSAAVKLSRLREVRRARGLSRETPQGAAGSTETRVHTGLVEKEDLRSRQGFAVVHDVRESDDL